MTLCCLQEFTEVTNGVKVGKTVDGGKGGETSVRNRFEALAGDEDGGNPPDDPESEGERHQEKTSKVVRRWNRNASQRKKHAWHGARGAVPLPDRDPPAPAGLCENKTRKDHRAVEACSEVCWLCEEYGEQRLPHTGVGCCFKPL